MKEVLISVLRTPELLVSAKVVIIFWDIDYIRLMTASFLIAGEAVLDLQV